MKKNIFKILIIVLLLILIIAAAILFVLYKNYMKYDDSKYQLVTYEKDSYNKMYVISILIPDYFEKKLEYELISRTEEKLKTETDPEKRYQLERRLQTDGYYYGYDDYDTSSSPYKCMVYIHSFEIKSTDKKPEKDLNYFIDRFEDDNGYEAVNIKAFSFKFDTIEIKKSLPTAANNNYYIYLENEKYYLIIGARLIESMDEKEVSEYLENLIKAVNVQQKTP